MKADGIEVEMPPLSLPHLFDRLMEVGPVDYGGMGSVPLGWLTISAWQTITATPIAPWEARLLRQASAEWMTQSRRAEKADCPAPWFMPLGEEALDAIERQLDAIFGA